MDELRPLEWQGLVMIDHTIADFDYRDMKEREAEAERRRQQQQHG